MAAEPQHLAVLLYACAAARDAGAAGAALPRAAAVTAWDRAEADLTRNSESADASSPPCASVFFDVRAAPAASLPLRFVTALAADLDSSALEAALDEFLRGLCVALSLLHNVIYVFLYM